MHLYSALDVGWVEALRNPTDYQDVGLRKASTQQSNFFATDENALNWFNHCGLFFEPI
ncbi:MAG: hypothetical protein V7K62_01255 [Nostoc sp.]